MLMVHFKKKEEVFAKDLTNDAYIIFFFFFFFFFFRYLPELSSLGSSFVWQPVK